MCSGCVVLRDIYWSDICATDSSAYIRYVDAIERARVCACSESQVPGYRRGMLCDVGDAFVGTDGSVGRENGFASVSRGTRGCDFCVYDARERCGSGNGLSVGEFDSRGSGGVSDTREKGGTDSVDTGSVPVLVDSFVENVAVESLSSQFGTTKHSDLKQNDVLGPNTLRNREWRKLKKQKKMNRKVRDLSADWRKSSTVKNGVFVELENDMQLELKRTRAARYIAENKYKTLQAERSFALATSDDVEALKRSRQVGLMKKTETAKVAVEKAFASLAQFGSSSGARTVLSNDGSASFSGLGSGTISPNSSISLAEIRELQKNEADARAKLEKYKNLVRDLISDPDNVDALLAQAFPDDDVDTGYTVDSEGMPVGAGALDGGFGGYYSADGKFHFGC